MSRVTTSNLSLGVWDEADNPGAGSKTVAAGNVGLNGNWLILDTAVGVGHDSAGAHKSDVIDGPSLKTSVADGSTIQLTGSPLKLQVKDDGVTGAKIAAAAVDDSTLEATAATGAKSFRVKDDGITGAKIAAAVVDDSTLEATAATGAKTFRIKDDGVTAAKISHTNNARKNLLPFTLPATTGYGYIGTLQCIAGFGYPMPHAGYITAIYSHQADGTQYSDTQNYSATGAAADGRFALGDTINVEADSGSQLVRIRINTTIVTGLNLCSWDDGQTAAVLVEVEFDDA